LIIIADTSGLLATINTDDPEHESCRKALATASRLVISPLVLAELDYLVAEHMGEDTAIAVADHIASKAREGHYMVAPIDADLLAATKHLRTARSPSDSPMPPMSSWRRAFSRVRSSASTAAISARSRHSPGRMPRFGSFPTT
jgi:uncharacterized protein with PIN domain